MCLTRCFVVWVMAPCSCDRETCLCKTHSNLELIIEKLVEMNVLSGADNVDRLCESIVCNTGGMSCIYGKCDRCANHAIDFCCDVLCCVFCCVNSDGNWCVCNNLVPKLGRFQNDLTVSFYSWQNKVTDDGNKSTVVVKQLETVEFTELVWRLNGLLAKARRHVFQIRHQYRAYGSVWMNID